MDESAFDKQVTPQIYQPKFTKSAAKPTIKVI
jgi:hypothetical protein